MAKKSTSNKKDDGIHVLPHKAGAFLATPRAAITYSDQQLFIDPDDEPVTLPGLNNDKIPKVVPWGEDNNTPDYIIEKIWKNPVTTSGMEFNILVLYGQGIKAGTFDENGKFTETDDPAVKKFFVENNINQYFLEQCTDLKFFFNPFPEIILSKDKKNPKLTELNHKEATFSRWGVMDDDGDITHHFYSANWNKENKTANEKNTSITEVLKRKNPLKDLRERIKSESHKKRFIIPLCFPTPGKLYYQKPYWYSIIDSGWLQFAEQIPEFKKTLLKNQASIKYHIEIHPQYFVDIFEKEDIKTPKAKTARVKKEYTAFNDFLMGNENAGKTVVSYLHKQGLADKSTYESLLKITKIDDKTAGGDYIEDSEEVSNMLSYALGVHPGIIGASPGKSTAISGSEARELFLIKQSMLKASRDMLLSPLYLIKEINGWPPKLEFIVPDMVLTTKDDNKSGATININESKSDE